MLKPNSSPDLRFIQHSIKEICELLNISRPSFYRYLNA
ncbi:MAG: helix-turn-helix domain-containing protein [Proteobacteria bacterium]|nr:helix-turn-helix domain-containing protein [Desulfocapsa sp.]MBU3946412.1 helix-turn-helix domain-containing protein [Pseudomonadota bacterium]MBU3983067.1 helix-turn-helix domain-containing protein [Pseudomonadota bacterium]MBU4030453.1 helix-turn-helix domain-containing protein [Pseudomonadota bacterium]MBU4042804.1 helix-turn-helix domain-containing protein [Pseudomonadota bacterium]